MKIIKTTKKLPVKLGDEVLLTRGQQLVENMRKTATAEAERDAENKRRKADIEILESVTAALAVVIKNGEEEQTVECEIRHDFDHNVVTAVRLDTGEVIETRAMDAAERQEELPGFSGDGPVTPSTARSARAGAIIAIAKSARKGQ